MDKNLVCPCGLTCCDCLFYKREIYETAAKLKQLIIDSHLDIFLKLISENEGWKQIARHLGEEEQKYGDYFEVFKKMADFSDVLDGIIKIQCQKTCRESGGCSIGGITRECSAIKCLKSRGYEGCWECAENENCDKLKFLRVNYGETIGGNFKIIKEKGIRAVPSRGKKYYEWQRRLYAKAK